MKHTILVLLIAFCQVLISCGIGTKNPIFPIEETLTQELMPFLADYINKGVNQVAGYKELMKKLHDNGILVQGCFAFGGDEEDTSVFERTFAI